MIEGVHSLRLAKIPDERGTIFHMLRSDDPHFTKFGEIYFSTVYPGVVKGWHVHKRMSLNYAVVVGMIKLVLYDDRKQSPTFGNLMELFIGEENYSLVTIPPGVVNGFKGIGTSSSLIANCTTEPHSSDEIIYIDPLENEIPYDWSLKHR